MALMDYRDFHNKIFLSTYSHFASPHCSWIVASKKKSITRVCLWCIGFRWHHNMPPAMKKSRIIHFLSTSNVLEKLLNMYEKWIGNRFNRIHQRPSNWTCSTSKNWKFELCEPHLCSATSVDFYCLNWKMEFFTAGWGM